MKRGILFPLIHIRNDEIEGDEILRLSFSTPLNLLGFNTTDNFHEREGGDFGAILLGCNIPGLDCYLEGGSTALTAARAG